MIIKSLQVKIIWKITKHLSKEFIHCLRYFSSFNSLILSTHLQVRFRRVLHNREKWDSEIKAKETVFRVTKASNSPGGIQASACTIADILADVPQASQVIKAGIWVRSKVNNRALQNLQREQPKTYPNY